MPTLLFNYSWSANKYSTLHYDQVLQMQEETLTNRHPSAAQNSDAYLQLLRRWRDKVGLSF